MAVGLHSPAFANPSSVSSRTITSTGDNHLATYGESARERAIGPSATGGGCAPDAEQSACISYVSSDDTLRGDFYINSWSPIVLGGVAKLYINVNGTYYYRYSIYLDHLGHYPVDWIVDHGSGHAYTRVLYYNASGGLTYAGFSPTVNYP